MKGLTLTTSLLGQGIVEEGCLSHGHIGLQHIDVEYHQWLSLDVG